MNGIRNKNGRFNLLILWNEVRSLPLKAVGPFLCRALVEFSAVAPKIKFLESLLEKLFRSQQKPQDCPVLGLTEAGGKSPRIQSGQP
jgi:hypothetical protein